MIMLPSLQRVAILIGGILLLGFLAEMLLTFLLLLHVTWEDYAPHGPGTKWRGRWFVLRRAPELLLMAIALTGMVYFSEVLDNARQFDPYEEAEAELRDTVRLWGYYTEYIHRRLKSLLG